METTKINKGKLTENDMVVIGALIRNNSEKDMDIIIDDRRSDEEIISAYIGIVKEFENYMYKNVGMRDKGLFKIFILENVNILMDAWNEVVSTSDKKDEVDELIDKLMKEMFGDKE